MNTRSGSSRRCTLSPFRAVIEHGRGKNDLVVRDRNDLSAETCPKQLVAVLQRFQAVCVVKDSRRQHTDTNVESRERLNNKDMKLDVCSGNKSHVGIDGVTLRSRAH